MGWEATGVEASAWHLGVRVAVALGGFQSDRLCFEGLGAYAVSAVLRRGVIGGVAGVG